MRSVLAVLAVLALGCGAGSPTVPDVVQSSVQPTPAPAELGEPTVYAPPPTLAAKPEPNSQKPTASSVGLECRLTFMGRDYLNTGSVWSATWMASEWSLVRGRWQADTCYGSYGATGWMGDWSFVVADSCGAFEGVGFGTSSGAICTATPRQ